MKNLRSYIILRATQSLSALGSGMTSYALVLWLYLNSGSALKTAMLFFVIGVIGTLVCALFTVLLRKNSWSE